MILQIDFWSAALFPCKYCPFETNFYHKETSQLINIEKNDWFLYGDGGDIGLSVANYRQITEVGKETKITTQFFVITYSHIILVV